ncbi:MAG: apolipoprotein N-acyltransferase [Thermodesulfobacteriota bacterium]|jgi:apolipoprotein N-acyltransferase|nr:apolipoprotein N-acyltransferase [Thermodesulfobacteriota bacterium]
MIPPALTSLKFWACVVSGLLMALAFPRPGLAELAWIGLLPLLLCGRERPFRSGFITGLVFFAVVLYWLNIVMTTYGGLHPLLSVAAYLMLVVYLALYWGATLWTAVRVGRRFNLSLIFLLPVSWIAFEFLRSFMLSGFPWATLGYTQHERLLLLQSADLFGVYGLSFLLVMANAVGFEILRSRKGDRKFPVLGTSILLLLLAAALGYGGMRLNSAEIEGSPLTVNLVQGNIDQGIKWNPEYQQHTIDTYRDLSLQASADHPADLTVWPESATPFYFQERSALSRQVRRVPQLIDGYLLFGSPAYEQVNQEYRYLNSAFLLSSEGEILGRSDKVHLVPFGEYVPLKTFLPFIDKLVVGIGDFSPGTVTTLSMNGASVGVLVCFEGIFPELARDIVRQGSDLLVNITNDAWFGRSSAPYQHLAMTRFRAVENRIWIARAANTGISAFISPRGEILAATPIFKPAVASAQVRLGAGFSLYCSWGDVLPTACGVFILCCLVRLWRKPNAANSVHSSNPKMSLKGGSDSSGE